MRVQSLVGLCFFPGVFLSSRVTGACPVTTDLIAPVNVRTTTTTTTRIRTRLHLYREKTPAHLLPRRSDAHYYLTLVRN